LTRTDDGKINLSIGDEGEGLPVDFDPRSASGLGMRIVRAFLQQLEADISVRRLDPGTEFLVPVPRDQRV
jgi:two-component sensor histidine kinase